MKAIRFLLSVQRAVGTECPIKIVRADRPGIVAVGCSNLWVDDDVPVIDLNGRGFIIGILFSRDTQARLLHLPAEAYLEDDARSLAEWIIHKCWGAYVAILLCPKTSSVNILVDPSGFCPVYRTETAAYIHFATDLEHFAQARGKMPDVSWQAVHAFLYRPELRQRETCLAGVTELAPGELVSITAGSQTSRLLWQPEKHIPGKAKMSFDEATAGLREVALMVCTAWARLLGPVTVAASGGVDSSLICAALAVADVPFSCATVATADPSGDERGFVHLLSDHLGVQCLSAIFDPHTIDPLRTISRGLARPSRKPFMAAFDAALFGVAAEANANIIFDGNGGDNLFCFLHSGAPIADRLRVEGIGAGTLSTFRDMCLVTGCDIPTMAQAVRRRLMRRDTIPRWPVDDRLLSRSSDFQDHMEMLTPWLGTSVGYHLGKRDHLALIMHAQLHIHGIAGFGLPRFSPLASQPLLEYCLSVPTWLWCHGGINRAVARAAFAPDLPSEIVKRTSKAGPDSFIHTSFNRSKLLLRELLLDGLLARHGVIDREAVAYAFESNTRSDGEIVLRLLDLAEAENWAQSWSS
jgi:asparagine synthase (glutamine-hydrolysing)